MLSDIFVEYEKGWRFLTDMEVKKAQVLDQK